jgi:hypothetical protein
LEFIGDFSSPRSLAQMKGASWASAGPLSHDVGLSVQKTEKEKENGLGRSRWAGEEEKGWSAGWASAGPLGRDVGLSA